MNDLVEFFMSKEILVVYLVIGIACILYFIVQLIDKTYQRRKQRQNTKELNQLVENVCDVVDQMPIMEKQEQPIVLPDQTQNLISEDEKSLPNKLSLEDADVLVNQPVTEKLTLPICEEEKKSDSIEAMILNHMPDHRSFSDQVGSDSNPSVTQPKEMLTADASSLGELMYTNIEPDVSEAQQELLRLTQELEQVEQDKNIPLTSFEEEQEKDAIISLEELMKKGKELVSNNEISQYADEGNEPISLEDLERKMKQVNSSSVIDMSQKEPVIIASVQEMGSEIEKHEGFSFSMAQEDVRPVYQGYKKFQSSPIISPIYGIEKKETSAPELELENTANYEKLDEEIKKTNEFLMTLKELQKHLE